MAMAWWISTGIYSKMEADMNAGYGKNMNFWTKAKFRDNIPLSFSHILPSIIIYGVATFISVMALILEISLFFCKKQKRQRNGRRRLAWPEDSPKQ